MGVYPYGAGARRLKAGAVGLAAVGMPNDAMSIADTNIAGAAAAVGRTSPEAARRLAQYGRNEVAEEQEHVLLKILRHFWAPVPWMLEATVVLQLVIGENIEAALIAALLIFNVALGAFQEGQANAALALLKQHLSLKARVRRDGRWTELPAALLVPGDVVQLSLAAVVPADMRIVEGSVLLDQSMLTGESVPADAGAGKLAYAGALVRRGEAVAVVAATGPAPISGAPPNWCASPTWKAPRSRRCPGLFATYRSSMRRS